MINLSQRIGIFYKDEIWGRECFEKIVSQIPNEYIKDKRISKMRCACELYNGDRIVTIGTHEGARGYKVTSAIVQEGIDERLIREVIYPCVKYPLAVVRSASEIIADYDSIRQGLPHFKKITIKC